MACDNDADRGARARPFVAKSDGSKLSGAWLRSVAVQHAAPGSADIDASVDVLIRGHHADPAELVRVVVEADPGDAGVVGAVNAPYAVHYTHHVDGGRVRGARRRLAQGDHGGALHVRPRVAAHDRRKVD